MPLTDKISDFAEPFISELPSHIITMDLNKTSGSASLIYGMQGLKLINIVYFPSSAQAELQLRLALTTPRKAPLERRKGNTQHLLVSTSGLHYFNWSNQNLLILAFLKISEQKLKIQFQP